MRVGDLFVQLSDTLVRGYDVVDFLNTLAEGCCAVLDADAAGVLLEKSGQRLAVTAASSEEMEILEAFELQEQTGPCYAAYREKRQVVIEDLEAARDRWPTFVRRALELGFCAAYAFPLRLRDDTVGALNLFRRLPGGLSDEDRRLGQSLADVATIGILQQRAVEDAQVRADQLQGALDSRVLIEQAKGVMAERSGVSVAEAFRRIREHSMHHNEPLRRICRRIVDGELDLR